MVLKELKSVKKKLKSIESDYKLKFYGKWKKFGSNWARIVMRVLGFRKGIFQFLKQKLILIDEKGSKDDKNCFNASMW